MQNGTLNVANFKENFMGAQKLSDNNSFPINSKNFFYESSLDFVPLEKKNQKKQCHFNLFKSENQKFPCLKNCSFHFIDYRKIWGFSAQPEFSSNFYDDFLESDEEMFNFNSKKYENKDKVDLNGPPSVTF